MPLVTTTFNQIRFIHLLIDFQSLSSIASELKVYLESLLESARFHFYKVLTDERRRQNYNNTRNQLIMENIN